MSDPIVLSDPGPRPPAATIPALAPLVSRAELERRFGDAGPVGLLCLELAERIVDMVPAGRELSTALTHVESAMMWANAGIARAGS